MNKNYWLDLCFDIIEDYIPLSIHVDKKQNNPRIMFYSIERHAISVIKLYEKKYASTSKNKYKHIADAYAKIAHGQLFICNYYDAVSLYKDALQIIESLFGEEHIETAMFIEEVGTSYAAAGDHTASLEYYLKAMDIIEKADNADNEILVSIYLSVACSYTGIKDYDKAFEYYGKAMEVSKYEKGHIKTANVFNGIGTTYYDVGDYEKAYLCHKRALEIYEAQCEVDSFEMASGYDCISGDLLELGYHADALLAANKALQIYKKIFFEKSHATIAMSQDRMGLVCQRIGNFEKALEYHLSALDTYIEIYGENHNFTTQAFDNLFEIYKKLGDNKKALVYCKKAMIAYEKQFGEEHEVTAAFYNNVAALSATIGDYGTALMLHKKSLSVHIKVNGEEHKNVATSYGNLGRIYAILNDYKQSYNCLIKEITIWGKLINTDSPPEMKLYNTVLFTLAQIKESEIFVEYTRNAALVYGNVFGKEHPYTLLLIKLIMDFFLGSQEVNTDE